MSAEERVAYLAKSGELSGLVPIAKQVRAALAPANPGWLLDRLSLLWDHMSTDRDPNRATAWLHETHRLLVDLPQDILGEAIDRAIKESERGFIPSVGAIRKHAEPEAADRERRSRILDGMVRAMASGESPGDDGEPLKRCTPEEADAIMREFGLRANPARYPEKKDESGEPWPC
jgi:hypothetical protein